MLQAADRPDYDEVVKRLGEKDAISGYTGNGPLGKNSETGTSPLMCRETAVQGAQFRKWVVEFRKNVAVFQGSRTAARNAPSPSKTTACRAAAVVLLIEEGDF